MDNQTRKLLLANKIDPDFTQQIITKADKIIQEKSDESEKLQPADFKNETSIIDLRTQKGLSLSLTQWIHFKSEYKDIPVSPAISDNQVTLSPEEVEVIGYHLIPKTAYGLLNGGSSTSYVDQKKNIEFNSDLYQIFQKPFNEFAANVSNLPKAVLPAWYDQNNQPGYSFLELKIRHFLNQNKKAAEITGKPVKAIRGSFFQMTSPIGDPIIQKEIRHILKKPAIIKKAKEVGFSQSDLVTFIQESAAALSKEGERFSTFTNKDGKENQPIALPGGHGLFFHHAKETLKELYRSGIRFITVGNIDNIGYTLDPYSIALTALKGAKASFEYIVRTPSDIKGGVLIQNENGVLDCGELGNQLTFSQILKSEAEGNQILFNCAIGLFDLKYLISKMDEIIQTLPLKLSYQDKSMGKYWQAEQNLWHVTGLIQNKLIFAVNKDRRFLAAKFLLESFIVSGFLNNQLKTDKLKELQELGQILNRGLNKIISESE